jgi:hypothetical protein
MSDWASRFKEICSPVFILGVSRYGKSVLRYIAIHDNRITIRIAIYCHGILLLEKKKTKQTQKFICVLKVAIQFVNKVSNDVVRGALKWFISLCEREVIQRIQGS